jgi:hypothetical protein
MTDLKSQRRVYESIEAMFGAGGASLDAGLPAMFAFIEKVGRSGDWQRGAVIALAEELVKKLATAQPEKQN